MTIATTPAPAPDALQRRVEDMPPAAARLDWEDDGTPLPASSVVYLFRSREAGFPLWDDIKTQERLELVKSAPDRFELRTLFTVPVDELWRAPLVTILSHLAALDKAKVARDAAVAQLQAALAALGELP